MLTSSLASRTVCRVLEIKQRIPTVCVGNDTHTRYQHPIWISYDKEITNPWHVSRIERFRRTVIRYIIDRSRDGELIFSGVDFDRKSLDFYDFISNTFYYGVGFPCISWITPCFTDLCIRMHRSYEQRRLRWRPLRWSLPWWLLWKSFKIRYGG